MTEPTIEETEARTEEFTDDLSDEALDREGGLLFACGPQQPCRPCN